MKKIDLIQKSPEWHAFRNNGVGASEIASICNFSSAFSNKNEVLFTKLGQVKPLNEFTQNLFDQGNEWEVVVRNAINENPDYKFEPVVAVHPENERYFASLDGVDENKKLILEIKHVNSEEKYKQYIAKPPLNYYAQVQWQLFVTGYEEALIAFTHDGDVTSVKIKSDQPLQKLMEEAAKLFLVELDAIKSGALPSPLQDIRSPDISRLITLKQTQKEMQAQIDVVDDEVKSLTDKIMRETGATKIENDFLSISTVEKKGNVEWKDIPEVKALDETYLNKFRKPNTHFYKVTIKNGRDKNELTNNTKPNSIDFQ